MRALDKNFVEILSNSIENDMGYNAEFALKVMGPYLPDPNRGFTAQYYKIKNGQHRYHAMKSFWGKFPPSQADMTLPCAIYPANLPDYQIMLISANIEHLSKADDIAQRNMNVLTLLESEFATQKKYAKNMYTQLYGKDPDATKPNWVDHLKKAFKFPLSSNFTSDRFVTNTSIEEAMLFNVTSKSGEGKLLFQYPYFHKFEADKPLNEVGLGIQALIREILKSPFSLTGSSYNSLYTFSNCIRCLSPFQVFSILDRYVKSLRRIEKNEDSEEKKKQTMKLIHKHFNAYAKGISKFIEYLAEKVPQNPELPYKYLVEGVVNTADVTSAELLHIFEDTNTNTQDQETVISYLNLTQSKQQQLYWKKVFESNEFENILAQWKATFEVQAVAHPVITSSWVVFESDGCIFNNCCAFDWIAEQERNSLKFNLILGDIPVSIILHVCFP